MFYKRLVTCIIDWVEPGRVSHESRVRHSPGSPWGPPHGRTEVCPCQGWTSRPRGSPCPSGTRQCPADCNQEGQWIGVRGGGTGRRLFNGITSSVDNLEPRRGRTSRSWLPPTTLYGCPNPSRNSRTSLKHAVVPAYSCLVCVQSLDSPTSPRET